MAFLFEQLVVVLVLGLLVNGDEHDHIVSEILYLFALRTHWRMRTTHTHNPKSLSFMFALASFNHGNVFVFCGFWFDCAKTTQFDCELWFQR